MSKNNNIIITSLFLADNEGQVYAGLLLGHVRNRLKMADIW